MGLSADGIASEDDPTLSEVYAASAYYYDPRAKIDQSIRDERAFVEEPRQMTRSELPEKLRT